MSDTKSELAEIIEAAMDRVHDMDVTIADYATAAAEDVLKGLPGLVPDLEWDWGKRDTAATHIFVYRVYDVKAGTWRMTRSFRGASKGIGDGVIYPTLEAAKAAANAHYKRTIMEALGIKEGE